MTCIKGNDHTGTLDNRRIRRGTRQTEEPLIRGGGVMWDINEVPRDIQARFDPNDQSRAVIAARW
jgi:hypothetical protein